MENKRGKFWENEEIKGYNISPQDITFEKRGARVKLMMVNHNPIHGAYYTELSGWMSPTQADLALRQYRDSWVADQMKNCTYENVV